MGKYLQYKMLANVGFCIYVCIPMFKSIYYSLISMHSLTSMNLNSNYKKAFSRFNGLFVHLKCLFFLNCD